MADRRNPVDAPPTPRIFRAPTDDQDSDEEVNQQEYINQLQGQLQEMREKMQQMEQQQIPTAPVTDDQSAPPGFSAPPFMYTSGGGVSHPQQPQFFYPQMPMMYPNQFPMYQTETRKKCTFKQFMDCKPPEYAGSTDPTTTLNWLREVDRALDACQCEQELRVLYACRLFKGRAMVWWDSITAHMTKEQLSLISWDQFYNKVCEQYCTSYEIDRIRREFMSLGMTEQMTVDDLIEQFNDKLRFVHQWVPDEQSRIQHFVNALLPEYRTMVRMAPSLSQAFVMAKMAESDVKAGLSRRRERIGQQQQKQATSGQSSSKSKKSVWSKMKGQFSRGGSGAGSSPGQKQWCQSCRASHVGPCSAETRRCIRCGMVGHDAQGCSFRTNVCWNCHKEGHRSAQCPAGNKIDSGSGSGRSTGSAGGSSASASGQKRKNPPMPEGRAFQMSVGDATSTDDAITGDK